MSRRWGRISFKLSLALVVPLVVALSGGWIAWWSYRSGLQAVERLSADLFARVAGETAARTREFLERAVPAAETLRGLEAETPLRLERERLARRLLAVLAANPGFAWVSFADAEGSFTGVYRTADGRLRANLSTIRDGKTVLDELDIEADGRWTPRRHADDTGYDPRTRPFYRAAVAAGRRAWTEPYVFFEQGVPGITCAQPLVEAGRVVGVFTIDFDLNGLSEFVRGLRFSPGGRVAVLAPGGVVLAHPTLRLVAQVGQGAEGRLVSARDVADPELAALVAAGPGAAAFRSGDEPWLAATRDVTIDGDVRWTVVAFAPERDFVGPLRAQAVRSLLVSLAAVVLAVLLSIVIAGRIAGPLVTFAGEMREVGDFRLDDRPARHSLFSELERMNEALAKMKGGLRSFASYVPRDLVRAVLASGQEARLAGEVKTLTVYFSDIAGFTTLAERMKPDELVQFLGGYLEEMTRLIGGARGTVDKFLGDGIMAFWGAPLPEPAHAALACEAALRCQRRLAELDLGVSARIGIATGDVLVGNIGAPERMNYTVMGDTANLASRLEGLNKAYGTAIMIAEATWLAARERVVARPVDVVAVKGKAQGVRVYEVLALAGEPDAADAAARAEQCTRALDAYLARDFAAAAAAWAAVLSRWPADAAAQVMRARAQAYAAEPPPADWSGVYVATEK